MKVLIIEDLDEVADQLSRSIVQKVPATIIVREKNLKNGPARLAETMPDAVVLDLYEDALGLADGYQTWSAIWQTRFCPIIFHTAHDKPSDPPLPENHPFVEFVKKGPGSDLAVAKLLESFVPHADALRAIAKQVDALIQHVLKDVAGFIWQAVANDRGPILARAVRRRIAAMMDEKEISDQSHPLAWEQYISPVISTDPLMGDLLRLRGEDAKDAATYRIVLTPSCDMVTAQGCKVEEIVAAKCLPIAAYLAAAKLPPGTKPRTIDEKLPSLLTRGHCEGIVPLPQFASIIPTMCASLRLLELIPLKLVGTPGSPDVKFDRVASIDSPFREQLAWCFMQVAGRPGIPDRNLELWVKDIQAALPPVQPAIAAQEKKQ